MKLAINLYINKTLAAELIHRIRVTEATIDIPGEPVHTLNSKLELISRFDKETLPAFHNQAQTNFSIEESYYGRVWGAACQTSSDNRFAIIVTQTDDGEDHICAIQYQGTRGRFLEELADWFGSVSNFKEIMEKQLSDAVFKDNCSLDVEDRDPCIDLYETTGPEDMLPWEDRGDYIIRQGGRVLREEVIEILTVLADNGIAIDWHFGVKDGEVYYTTQYTYCSALSQTDNAIMQHWFADAATRDKRVATAQTYARAREAADMMLNLVE